MIYHITGAKGFIGSAVKNYLQAKREAVNDIYRDYYSPFNEEFVFIHCAAYGNHSNQEGYAKIVKANCTLLMHHVRQAMEEKKLLHKFYNFSSSSVHLKHQTLYSATKLVGEKIIESLNDPRFVNVRPYSIFGKGEAPHRFIPTVIRCLNTGESMPLVTDAAHDWTHIDDFIPAMFNGHTELGTGESYTNLEVVRMLEDISGKKLNFEKVESLRPYDTDEWKCPEPIPHKPLYERLSQVYDELTKNT